MCLSHDQKFNSVPYVCIVYEQRQHSYLSRPLIQNKKKKKRKKKNLEKELTALPIKVGQGSCANILALQGEKIKKNKSNQNKK